MKTNMLRNKYYCLCSSLRLGVSAVKVFDAILN